VEQARIRAADLRYGEPMTSSSPPTRPALRKRYDSRRDRVVAAAAKLFAVRGAQETSISDLTEATGLASGGIYHYIGSKDALLFTICDELMVPLLAQADEIAAGDEEPTEQFRLLVRAGVERVVSHRDHARVLVQERPTLEADRRWRRLRKQQDDFQGILDRVLARGEAAGTMHFEDRRFALATLNGMVNHVPYWLAPRGRLAPTEVADRYVDLMLCFDASA
jgi:TetR/AcrR family transcriptional regulator, cholesterol catabolism regulator